MESMSFIPRHQFSIWYECLKSNNGRLLANPVDGDDVCVRFFFANMDEYNAFSWSFRRLTTPVVEKTRKYHLWHKLKVKLKKLL
tara:strand:+ start:31893 stop:32144 length:252 start_codon:yes stop_codon:yes gene_type:complete